MELTVLVPLLIFGVALFFILSEKIHRTIVALVGAAAMVIAGHFLGFYGEIEAITAVDFNTIGLLMGMMILVALLANTGVFEYLAIYAGQKAKGRPWALLVILGLTTGVVSMILDNVTTVILIAPVTLKIASILRINPIPLLIGEALLSNTMGTGTLVGDPPNIIIGAAADLSFSEFIIHLTPIAIIATLCTLIALRIVFRKQLAEEPHGVDSLLQMDPKHSIKDAETLRKVLIVIGLVVVAFFVHGQLHLLPATVAIAGAALALLWVRPKVDEVLGKVEWSVLLFFAGLFVMVGGLESAEILSAAAGGLQSLTELDPAILGVSLIWLAAIISALVDNIPFTIAAVPVVESLSESAGTGNALWWALAMGAGFGGNGTPIGSTAGVIVVNMSEKTDTPITFRTWVLSGTVATLVSVTIGSIAMALFFDFFR